MLTAPFDLSAQSLAPSRSSALFIASTFDLRQEEGAEEREGGKKCESFLSACLSSSANSVALRLAAMEPGRVRPFLPCIETKEPPWHPPAHQPHQQSNGIPASASAPDRHQGGCAAPHLESSMQFSIWSAGDLGLADLIWPSLMAPHLLPRLDPWRDELRQEIGFASLTRWMTRNGGVSVEPPGFRLIKGRRGGGTAAAGDGQQQHASKRARGATAEEGNDEEEGDSGGDPESQEEGSDEGGGGDQGLPGGGQDRRFRVIQICTTVPTCLPDCASLRTPQQSLSVIHAPSRAPRDLYIDLGARAQTDPDPDLGIPATHVVGPAAAAVDASLSVPEDAAFFPGRGFFPVPAAAAARGQRRVSGRGPRGWVTGQYGFRAVQMLAGLTTYRHDHALPPITSLYCQPQPEDLEGTEGGPQGGEDVPFGWQASEGEGQLSGDNPPQAASSGIRLAVSAAAMTAFKELLALWPVPPPPEPSRRGFSNFSMKGAIWEDDSFFVHPPASSSPPAPTESAGPGCTAAPPDNTLQWSWPVPQVPEECSSEPIPYHRKALLPQWVSEDKNMMLSPPPLLSSSPA